MWIDVNPYDNCHSDGAGRHPGCVNLLLSWFISQCRPEPAACSDWMWTQARPARDHDANTMQNKTKEKKSNCAINLKLRRRAFTQGGSLPHNLGRPLAAAVVSMLHSWNFLLSRTSPIIGRGAAVQRSGCDDAPRWIEIQNKRRGRVKGTNRRV